MKSFQIKKQRIENKSIQSKIRIVNRKYNSLGVTIPKEVCQLINLKKGDLMNFEIVPNNESNITLNIDFLMK